MQQFVPPAWVLLVVSGQERCGPANDVSAVEGGWLTLDHADRLKKVPVTSGGDWRNCNWSGWWLLQYLPHSYYSNAVLSLLANDDGASRLFGDVLNESERLGLLERFHCRLVNDENGEVVQGPDIPVVVSHRSSDLSSISCSLELLRVAHNYGECFVFV